MKLRTVLILVLLPLAILVPVLLAHKNTPAQTFPNPPKTLSYQKTLKTTQGPVVKKAPVTTSSTSKPSLNENAPRWSYYYDSLLTENCRTIYKEGTFEDYKKADCVSEEQDKFGKSFIEDAEYLCENTFEKDLPKKEECRKDLWTYRADVLDFLKNNQEDITKFASDILHLSLSFVPDSSFKEAKTTFVKIFSELTPKLRQGIFGVYVFKLLPRLKEGHRVDGILLDELEDRAKRLEKLEQGIKDFHQKNPPP